MNGIINDAPLLRKKKFELELQASVFGARFCKFTFEQSPLKFNCVLFGQIKRQKMLDQNNGQT